MGFQYLWYKLSFSLCLILVITGITSCDAQTKKFPSLKTAGTQQKDSLSRIKIIAAGDLIIHGKQIENAWEPEEQSYQFNTCFYKIKDLIESADIALVNFEACMGGEPYRGFPDFSSPDTLAYAVKYAGFDVAFLANNHAADKGAKGIRGNIENLSKNGIITTGTFLDSADRQKRNLVLISKNNIKIAFLNYSYGTNGKSVPKPYIINRIDTTQMLADLQIVLNSKPDIIIVFVHWGEEYKRYPSKFQQRIADFCFRNGVDIILGSHPHVLQPLEIRDVEYQGKHKKCMVAYSLGNFISNQRRRYRDGATLLEFDVTKDNKTNTAKFDNIRFIPTWVYMKVEKGRRFYSVLPVSRYEQDNTILNIDKYNLSKMKTSAQDTREMLKIEGVEERILK
ncbi:MAG: CapA family protein [FCB group bacterium]|jgi:poly-gamma-glutamate synthesis protein (capsule biosynthesis protein)